MAVIGELAVNVVARTDKLTKGLASARKQVTLLGNQFKSATVGLTRFTGAALGIGGAGGIFAVANSMRTATQEIDRLAKSSQKLGIATEELAGLHVAAERTGVQINQLEMGLQRMVRRVSEAAKGTGEAQDAIKELGLDAAQLNRLAPEKQFAAIAQRMSLVANQSDKVRLAFKLFDSEGVNLVRTLNLGAAGLQSMQKEAEKLGLAVSAEEAAKIEKFNDEVGRLSGLFKGLGRELTINISGPAIQAVEGLRAIAELLRDERAAGTTAGRAFGATKEALGKTLAGPRFVSGQIKRGVMAGFDAQARRLGRPIGESATQQQINELRAGRGLSFLDRAFTAPGGQTRAAMVSRRIRGLEAQLPARRTGADIMSQADLGSLARPTPTAPAAIEYRGRSGEWTTDLIQLNKEQLEEAKKQNENLRKYIDDLMFGQTTENVFNIP